MIRENCVYSGTKLQDIYCIPQVPIFCGCVENIEQYKYEDLIFSISDNGLIQIKNLIQLEDLYKNNHNDSVGSVWEKHHISFSEFISPIIQNKKVFEYGGASGKLYNLCQAEIKDWTIIDFNPMLESKNKLNVLAGDASNFFDESYEVYVSSHFLEHLYEPFLFLEKLRNIKKNGIHAFSIPNQKLWFNNIYTNSVFFEHTVLLDEEFILQKHEECGFTLIKKQYFDDHSIFYMFKKTEVYKKNNLINKYEENINVLESYKIKLNERIEKYKEITKKQYNIFSAHINTQVAFSIGLNVVNCVNIIDNSSLKHGKYLYGYDILVVPPANANKHIPTIVLDSPYKKEISAQLISLGYENVI